MSIILNIDTSQETAFVCLSNNGEIIALHENKIQREHASFVHTAILALMLEKGLYPKDLNAIAVTIGPGSYTGLRVGLAAAKGLCYVLNIPLITVGTLEIMAKDVIVNSQNKNDFLFCPLIDARRMEVFTAIYDINMHEIAKSSAHILTNHSFTEYFTQKNVIFFGSGMIKWKNICTNENAFFTENNGMFKSMVMISLDKYLLKCFTSLADSIPLYTKAFYNP